MRQRIHKVLLALVMAVVAAFGAGIPAAEAGPSQRVAPAVPAAAGQFHSARAQLLSGASIAASATLTVKVAGVGGLPASGLDTVWIDFAVKGTGSADGALVPYPSDGTRPGVSGSLYEAGGYNHDLLPVKVGADGAIKIGNFGNVPTAATVYAVVHGYTLTSAGTTAGSTFTALSPARVLNGVTVPAQGSYTFSPLGQGGVPSSGVSEVVFTLTGSATAATRLTVHPSDTGNQVGTDLTLWAGNYRDNLVIGKLGPDGKVTIGNLGTTAAKIWADVSGYYASPQASLAGGVERPLTPARVLGPVNVAANGTYAFAPLGKGGVPATGVSAVGLNISVRSADTGYVRVYPSGETPPGTRTVGYPTADRYNAGFVNAKPGADGKIIISNPSPSAVSVSLDAYAYFVPSTGCTSAPAPARAAASLPVESFSATNVLQRSAQQGTSLGMIEYVYTDNIGRLMHGRQDPDSFNSLQWTAISGNEAFTGTPGMAEQADGRLQIAAHNTSGDVWTRPQKTGDLFEWGDWADVPQAMASHATLVRHGDTLVAFAVDGSGVLWALPQKDANGTYGSWVRLGFSGLTGTPAAIEVGNGVRVFALDSAGDLKTALYTGGVLSQCASLGGSGLKGTPSLVKYPGGKVRIFARSSDDSIVTKIQDDSGDFPAAWDQVGTFKAAGSPSALLSPAGKTEVVARAADGRLWSSGETAQASGTWRDWVQAQTSDDTFSAATDPVAFTYTNTSGPTWGFVARDADQRSRLYYVDAAGSALAKSALAFRKVTLPAPPPAK
ncbi:hypothetical protein [Actinomadura macrotermitis]|uniref:PLL-like beta propeller domain-containing protein n=1 Tax=Actinomadura macrotermitis TaxID=2585200 RepID=A0A7K0BYF0_9ACTN|nr:hypothetical protein [Actinomadura macrotermitis]MQY06205.1 hypothetical protein [Actinomadura macrotermitis]